MDDGTGTERHDRLPSPHSSEDSLSPQPTQAYTPTDSEGGLGTFNVALKASPAVEFDITKGG